MQTAEIVVVGSYNRDVVLSVAELPAPGETCLALGRLTAPGGKGSNQAVQAARAGARVAMLAALGDDLHANEAVDTWVGCGIDVSGVARLAGRDTGMAVVMVDAHGENSIIVDAGANTHLDESHVEAGAGLIRGAKLVVAQLETPVAATRRAFEIARETGVTTLLNAAPAPDAISDDLLAVTDILVVNEGEGQRLTGAAHAHAIGPALLQRVGQAAIVTLGAQGAVLLHGEGEPVTRGAHRVEVVDTTGAGDAFIGAFAARLAATGEPGEALAWGLAAGALACTRLGATDSFAEAGAIAALAAA